MSGHRDPNRDAISRLVPPVHELQQALTRNAEDADILRRLLRASLDYERRREGRQNQGEGVSNAAS